MIATPSPVRAAEKIFENRSLCLCLTPLHTIIARQISEFKKEKFSRTIYISNADNPKNRRYAADLTSFSMESEYICPQATFDRTLKGYFDKWKTLSNLRKKISKYGTFDEIYIPTSINQFSYAVASAHKKAQLSTYSDGILDIQPNPPKEFNSISALEAVFLSLCGINRWPSRIRKDRRHHYHVLPERCEPGTDFIRIELLKTSPSSRGCADVENEDQWSEVLILGPIPEAADAIYKALISASTTYRATAYLPHPREKTSRFPMLKRVETDMIAEDYVLSRLVENPGLTMTLIGYDSATLAHLASVERLKCLSVMGTAQGDTGMISLFASLGVKVA